MMEALVVVALVGRVDVVVSPGRLGAVVVGAVGVSRARLRSVTFSVSYLR